MYSTAFAHRKVELAKYQPSVFCRHEHSTATFNLKNRSTATRWSRLQLGHQCDLLAGPSYSTFAQAAQA